MRCPRPLAWAIAHETPRLDISTPAADRGQMLLGREVGDLSAIGAEESVRPQHEERLTCALVIAVKALANAVGSCTSKRCSSIPNDRAAPSIAFNSS